MSEWKSEWKALGKDFERDMREAFESVRDAVAIGDARDLADNAAEFAQTIAECALMPVMTFLGGLPRAVDAENWSGWRRWASPRAWDDEG